MAEINEESFILEVYLCESCWKVLINFYKKEIKKLIQQTLTIPTTERCENYGTHHS